MLHISHPENIDSRLLPPSDCFDLGDPETLCITADENDSGMDYTRHDSFEEARLWAINSAEEGITCHILMVVKTYHPVQPENYNGFCPHTEQNYDPLSDFFMENPFLCRHNMARELGLTPGLDFPGSLGS